MQSQHSTHTRDHDKPLRPGDLVVVQNATYFEEWNGYTATVVAAFAWRSSIDMHTMTNAVIFACRVQLEDGTVVMCRPHQVMPLPSIDLEESLAHTLQEECSA